MKKRRKKKVERKKFKVKENSSTGILSVILAVALLALFSETVRTLPAGALIGKNFFNPPYEVPRLNSEIIEKRLLEKFDYRRIHKEIIFKKASKKKKKKLKKLNKISKTFKHKSIKFKQKLVKLSQKNVIKKKK